MDYQVIAVSRVRDDVPAESFALVRWNGSKIYQIIMFYDDGTFLEDCATSSYPAIVTEFLRMASQFDHWVEFTQ